MKSTRSGTKWAHVSCALWIPEVSIGSVDRMEPITKISNIPQSRWALNCILCREKVGACIQCSVKTCKTAYHVTCAFQHGLEMRAIIEDEHNEDGVKLRSYCQKHSTTKTKKDGKSSSNKTTSAGSGTDEDDNKRRRTRKEMTTEERNQVRAQRLAEIESEFHKHVNIKDISCHLLDIDQEGINYIYNYWILKRKSGNNRPLLPPKNEDAELASQKEENQEQEKMRMFVQLRQDLERVRNLCYMVSRREKLSRSFFKLREQTFHKQVGILSDLKTQTNNANNKKVDETVVHAVIEANHGPSIYDKFYSSDSVSNIINHSNSEVANNIDVMLDRLMNINSSRHKSPRQAQINSIDLGSNSSLDKINLSPHKSRQSVDINGINNNNKKNLSSKSSSASAAAATATTTESRNISDNPYKRTYFNGTRRSASLYSSTGISSDSDQSRSRRTLQGNIAASSSENESQPTLTKASSVITSPNPSTKAPTKLSPRRRTQNAKTLERKRRRDAKQQQQQESVMATSKFKSNSIVDSSSEDETNRETRFNNTRSPRNRTLQQMEKEMERSHLSDSTDSDELTGICYKPTSYSHATKVSNAIYSDSDSTDKDKTDNTASDSQQHPFRTKAAMKEFNMNAVTSSNTTLTSPLAAKQTKPKGILKNAGEKISLANVTNLEHNKTTNAKSKSRPEKGSSKKNDFPADLLVVPQRQAAKKASENLMRTNVQPTIVQQQQQQQVMEKSSKKDNKLDDVETEVKLSSRVSSVTDEIIVDKKSDRSKGGSSKVSTKGVKRQESKDHSSDRESKRKDEIPISTKKDDPSSFIDLSPYVPQRQAAKKAAEHIKSTVLKPSETAVAVVAPEPEKVVQKKSSKKDEKDAKNDASESSSSESDSSSSSSSSGSGSKSSSSSSEESEPAPPPQKVTQKRQSTNSNKTAAVVASRRTSDKTKDLPFLDKGNKSVGTVFCSSSDSDSKSSSDESVAASHEKHVPAKITKRKSSSAATSVSHKSTSSGVGTSTGTNTTCGPGRPRGRPRTKSIFKETENAKAVRSPSGSVKEVESKTSTSKKDEAASRRLSNTSSNVTPTKTTTRGRRDSKVQISENATPSSRRRTSDVSPRASHETPDDGKTRRRSITTRRESLTSPLKDKIPPVASEPHLVTPTDIVKKDTDIEREREDSKPVSTITTRKRKLSTATVTHEDEKCSSPVVPAKETPEAKSTPDRDLSSSKTDTPNDKARVITPTKCDENQISTESPSNDRITTREKIKTPIKEMETTSRPSSRTLLVQTPEKVHKSPIKKPTRTSSDMEIDPMNSPLYVPQLTQKPNVPEQKPSVISAGITSDIVKNNGPKSIFDLTDDLTENTETHFEVPPTPLGFTSHHTDWLKVDANEDTEQATMDLVEKLRQNKHKKQSELSGNLEHDLNQKTDVGSLEMDTKQKMNSDELNLQMDLNRQQTTMPSIDSDDVFDRPLDKLNTCRVSQIGQLNTVQDTIMSQQKGLLGQNQQNSMGSPNFNQDSYLYGRRWNEADIIARRRSVSSSPASTVSDNTELTQQQPQHSQVNEKNQNTLHQNIPCALTTPHLQQHQQHQQKMNQQQGVIQMQPQLSKPTFLDTHQLPTQQPMLSQDQIPLQIQNHNQMPHGQQPMVQFPPLNQSQMMPQNRFFKPESCMFYNQPQQGQSKPAIGLQSSPTYQMGPRPVMFANRMPIGNKADDRNMNMQNYRQTNPNVFMNQNNAVGIHDPSNNLLQASLGSPQQEAIKIKSSPHSNKNTMMQQLHQQHPGDLNQPLQAGMAQQQQATINESSNAYGLPNIDRKPAPSTVSLADLKKSPAKTVPKLSVRNTYQQNIENMQNQVRSPHLNTKMSPGKSPRQMDMISKQVNATEKRGKNAAAMSEPPAVKARQRSNSTKNTGQSNRGRNTGANKKGRGRNLAPFNEFDFGGTNHSNLAGTAYDLDLVEEENFTLENFRTSLLRDRKKSNDTTSMDYLRSREPSQSPKFSSPKNRSMYSSAANTPNTGTTPSGNTPLHQGHHPLMTPEVNNSSVNTMTPTTNVPTSLHEMVLPVLPGPVDMRTYNSNFDSSTNNELFNNHLLGAFDSGTADHTLADIDEEMEKELQSALKASNSKAKETSTPVATTIETTTSVTQNTSTSVNNCPTSTVITNQSKTTITSVGPEPSEEVSVDSDTMKVSFSDSRNQLKLKIKGPLAPDGYSSTFIQKTVETSISAASTAPTVAPGLRRMRKKELLRQYWNQDANLDDQTSSSMGDTNPSVPVYSLPNRVAGIPKAVDSMSSIPTKEDYKDYNMTDTKKRKKVSGLQRELRQLTGVVEDETVERRRSIGAASDKSSNASTSGRSRLNRSGPAVGQTPKLKIKIGSNIIEPTGVPSEEIRQSDRPPKKRLDNMAGYSFEDFRRDSLKFGMQVYADYDKKEKVKEKGVDKEKKKKKKDKKRKVEVIENNQKFVLKIKKPKLDSSVTESVIIPEPPPNSYDPNAEDPLNTDNTVSAPTVAKSAPIKLKLSRTSGTTDSYTLASKQVKPPTAKKQNKKQASKTPNNQKPKPKDSNTSAPIKKRELTECRLQLEKLDQDTIKKFASKAGSNKMNASVNEKSSDASITDSAKAATQPTVDSHLGAANEINNSNLNIRSSSNNNTNISESNSKDEPVNKNTENTDETKMVHQENSSNAIKQKSSEQSAKDCEVR